MDNQKRINEIKIELSDLDIQYSDLKKKDLPNHEYRMQYEKLASKCDELLQEYYKLTD